MGIISLEDVWLRYKVEFKEDGKFVPEFFWAVKGVSIEIEKGDVFGIIGENGAGKTTLLRLISGMLKPDRGRVAVEGTISALMDIGLGFQGDLTGRENIYLISSIHGFAKDDIMMKCADIEKFADIGKFINAPVKSYSHGMYMRLAFAIAIHMDSDILLIDDILAVGDVYAQNKCINKIFELKEQGKTIIFISHDIELSKRLCSRGMFIREGVTLKDGDIAAVYNYYLEITGNKSGIGILEKGNLTIIFNNGKIIIRWKGMAITNSSSWHVILFSSGRQFLSTSACWDVGGRAGKDEISVFGSWPDMPLRLEVRILTLNEREFICEIRMSESEGIDEFHCNLLLSDGYERYFTIRQKAPFPEAVRRDGRWEVCKINESDSRLLGVAAEENSGAALPVIVVEKTRDDSCLSCMIGNAGFNNPARVIQYIYANPDTRGDKTAVRKIFSAKIGIFEPWESLELEKYLRKADILLFNPIIIGSGSVNISCRPDRTEIYWKNILISHGPGLHTQFRHSGLIYKSSDAQWKFDKKNNNEIFIILSWADNPSLRQLWNLKTPGEGLILWEVRMEVCADTEIKGVEVELLAGNGYARWATLDEAGDFSRIEKMGDTVVLEKYINPRVRITSNDEIDDGAFPSLSFEYVDKIPKALYISKLSNEGGAVRLKYAGIGGVCGDLDSSSDGDPSFRGIITLGGNGEKSEHALASRQKTASGNKKKSLPKKVLCFKNLTLAFDAGKCGISWNNMELTKGMGLYSSFFYEKRWYDSSQAFWDVRDLNAAGLTVVGYWPLINLTQAWDIRLLDEKRIIVGMTRECRDSVVIEKWQSCLMLSDRYRQWFVEGHERGRFPESFNAHNGLCWDRVWFGHGALRIGVKRRGFRIGFLRSAYLPVVSLECLSSRDTIGMAILNTDDLHEARILQCGSEDRVDTGKVRHELLIKIFP